MVLSDYSLVKDVYDIKLAFNNDWIGNYTIALDDKEYVKSVYDCIKSIRPSNVLKFDCGAVYDFKDSSNEGFVVIQSIYCGIDNVHLPDFLHALADYIQEIGEKGGKWTNIIQSYSDKDFDVHTADISFFIPKSTIDYNF